MDTEKISKYRSAVMGFSILWIMAFHSNISFSAMPFFGVFLNNFRSNGFGGVDIFLFLSGFGMSRSLSRDSEQMSFYKRRFWRVMPAYMPVLVIWLILRCPDISLGAWLQAVLRNLTGISFWIGSEPVFNWYMPALFSFYFIAPVFFEVMERRGNAGWIIVATLALDVCFYGNNVMIAVTRFTVFAMGMALGCWEAKRGAQEGTGRPVGRFAEIACYGTGIFSYWMLVVFRASFSEAFLWNGGFYWYPFIFAAPAMIFILCRFFSFLESRATWLLHFFESAGKYSLEIYLIHIVAFEYIHPKSNKAWLLIIISMVFCGYIYHIAISKICIWSFRVSAWVKVRARMRFKTTMSDRMKY